MCKIIEDRVNATRHEAFIEVAVNLIKKGILSLEDIAECSTLPLDEVKELAEKQKPATA